MIGAVSLIQIIDLLFKFNTKIIDLFLYFVDPLFRPVNIAFLFEDTRAFVECCSDFCCAAVAEKRTENRHPRRDHGICRFATDV